MREIDEDLLMADPWPAEDHDGQRCCELCGQWKPVELMSIDVDGYCMACIDEIKERTNMAAQKEFDSAEYDLYRAIFEPVGDVA